jgi:hypothetical protein
MVRGAHSPDIGSEAAAKSIRNIDRAMQSGIRWNREMRFVSNELRVLKPSGSDGSRDSPHRQI